MNPFKVNLPAPRGCPICGAYPITSSCVRDWLLASNMPLHGEWQERMAEYANEIIGNALLDAMEARRK